ncbi:MAG: hypothetical protein ACRCT7_17370 [Shewanella sp.]
MDWQYHGEAPKAGRKLLLVLWDEIPFALPLMYRYMTKDYYRRKPEWFEFTLTNEQSLSGLPLFANLNELMKSLLELRRQGDEQQHAALAQVNLLLNQYFSDLGWRMVRRELSQIKKRQKKGHIEVSKDIIEKLKSYMVSYQFDSFDDAIDNLLSVEVNTLELD